MKFELDFVGDSMYWLNFDDEDGRFMFRADFERDELVALRKFLLETGF
jgi:hypothetical protein